MGRTLIIAALMALLLAGCGGEKQQAADPPSASVSVTSAAPSTVAPVMPALAKEHTEAGAKAFIVYAWQMIDFATETLNPGLVEPLMSPTCGPCRAGIDGIRKDVEEHAVVKGGTNTLSGMSVKEFWVAGNLEVLVSATVHNTEQVITPSSPGAPTTYAAAATETRWRLRATDDGWVISEWNPRA